VSIRQGDVLLTRYTVERQIGEGGMGQVFLGRHSTLGMAVALKVLSPGAMAGMAQRFEREAKLMARIRHPNVVAILDYGFLEDGSPCIAMEFVEGEGLDRRLGRGAMPWPAATHLISGVLSGLQAMHDAHVLHRDLKPANVVVTSGRSEVARIIDFGIALPTGEEEQRFTRTGAIVGTPAYMAPEQLLGCPMDGRSDVYGAGLMYFEMLAGAPPFPGTDLSSVLRRLQQRASRPRAPAGLPEIPVGVVDALMAALDPEMDRRPPSAEDLVRSLAAAASLSASAPAAATLRAGASQAPAGLVATVMGEVPASGPLPGALDPTGIMAAAVSGDTAVQRFAASQEAEEKRRFLVIARLLPSRLASPQERAFLAALVGSQARAYSLGGRYWFALESAASPASRAEAGGQRIVDAIRERYGGTAVAERITVESGFVLTASALTGTAPMPEEVSALIAKIERA
jgi:serine/threonine-protein kinase